MARNPRYDVLFEPVKIGPVTARNRFYAVPHAAGMTNAMPHMRAAFRGTKAEGGWGVVCTGYVSIDPSSDDAPLPFATLWDDDDVRSHALMTDAVHTARRACRHRAVARRRLGHEPRQPYPAHVALGHRLDGRRTSTSWATSARGSWKPQDIQELLDWQAGPRAGHAAPASTSSTCTPAWATCRTSFCCPSGITVPMPTAARVAQSGAHRARTARGHARGGGRQVRGRAAHQPGGAARPTERERALRSARGRGPARRAAGSVGREDGLQPDRLRAVTLHPRGQSRADHRLRQAADHEAGGRRRPLHLSGHDGRADPARRPRSDRAARGPRSPTRSCRRRSTRGASRTSASASAATSASRAGTTACRCAARRTRPSARNGAAAGTPSASRRRKRRLSAHRRRRPGGTRVRADARAPRLRGHRGGGGRRDRRPPALRDALAGARRLGPGARLAPRAARAA